MKSNRIRTFAGCTLNNPTVAEIAHLKRLTGTKFRWAVFALEEGESGTTHVQAAWSFKHGKTFAATKKFLGSDRWHLEEMRSGAFAASHYCLKGDQTHEEWDDSGVDGDGFGVGLNLLAEYGTRPEASESKDCTWTQIIQAIQNGWSNLEIVNRWPSVALRTQAALDRYRLDWESTQLAWRDVDVEYWWGPTGTGKTRGALYSEEGLYDHRRVYRATNSKHPWDKYDGQPVVVIEEFRGQWACRDMLNWLDGHPLFLPARYADRVAKFTKVIIISNWDLDAQYEQVQMNSPSTWNAFHRRIGSVRFIGEPEPQHRDLDRAEE